MVRAAGNGAVLLCLTGLHIEGGIASVNRCIARVLDEQIDAGRLERVDRVLLLDDPSDAAPGPSRGEQHFARGNRLRFVWHAWRSFLTHRHDLVLFDLPGPARVATLPLPAFPPPRYAVFTHWYELRLSMTRRHLRALDGAHRLLANSNFSAEELAGFRPGVAERVVAVPLCIDPRRLAEWETSSETAEGPREHAALIVARMSRSERSKGHDAVLDAWSMVRQQLPTAQLWIAGRGDDMQRLRRRVSDAGLDDAVRFHGQVESDALSSLYRRASVFVMPSRQEGFGIVYAEAMWHGLPCIGSTADAAGEVIEDGRTGLLVPYGDATRIAEALTTLLGRPELARSMGQAGRRRVLEHYGFERFRSNLLAALELA